MRQLSIKKQVTGREAESLNKYLKEINREKLITIEEEVILAQKIKHGDINAIGKLTKANLRFVVSVAKQFQNRGLPLVDLINEGNIGLIRAAKRFDETRGFKLITYAVWYIRQAIQEAINEQSLLVRLPPQKIDLIKRIRKATSKMEQQYQREPSNEEIANEICISIQSVNEAISSSTRQVSMDAPLSGRDDLTLMDLIEDKESESSEQKHFNLSLRKEIETVLATLPANEAQVLHLYFGLNDQKALTLKEIAVRMSVGSEKIRQIKEKALLRLKHTSRSKLLKEYLG